MPKHPQFATHTLSPEGQEKAAEIREAFDTLLTKVHEHVPEGRERALVATKLEEACMFAVKGMAKDNAIS